MGPLSGPISGITAMITNGLVIIAVIPESGPEDGPISGPPRDGSKGRPKLKAYRYDMGIADDSEATCRYFVAVPSNSKRSWALFFEGALRLATLAQRLHQIATLET